MVLLLILVIILLLVGGGGYYGRRLSWSPRGFAGLLVTVLIVVILVWALNDVLMPPVPMPAGVPSISK